MRPWKYIHQRAMSKTQTHSSHHPNPLSLRFRKPTLRHLQTIPHINLHPMTRQHHQPRLVLNTHRPTAQSNIDVSVFSNMPETPPAKAKAISAHAPQGLQQLEDVGADVAVEEVVDAVVEAAVGTVSVLKRRKSSPPDNQIATHGL